MSGLDALVAVARLGEAAAAAALFGAPLLLRLASTPPDAAPAEPAAGAVAALSLAAGSLLALVGQTATMAGSLGEALAPATLLDVLAGTAFGRSVLVRLAVAVAAAALALAGRARGAGVRTAAAALGAVALASLAWSGHGAADGGLRGLLHLGGDVLHLLAAGAWLGALGALAVLAVGARARPGGAAALERGLLAFSGVGVAVVAVLLASGIANAVFLGALDRWRELGGDAWGRLLILKLALFAAMLALAALNRWRWTPALAAAAPDVAVLRRSLVAEAGLGLAVFAAAAAMGGLAPPSARG